MEQQARLRSGVGPLDRLDRVPHVRVGAAVALALAAAFIVWLVVGSGGHSSTAGSQLGAAVPTAGGTGPVAESAQGLQAFAAAVGHPIYWAGASPGSTYELTQTGNGRVYIRYLPAGVRVGVDKPYLTIATYPFPHAFAVLKAMAKQHGGAIKLDHGGIGLVDRAYPKSVHLAFPGSDYQIEVFSPSPATSRQVVVAGGVAPVR